MGNEEQALSIIRSGSVDASFPAYILDGEDEYLIDGVLSLLRAAIIDEGFREFNLTRLECSAKTGYSEISDALLELPMLTQKRLLELHNPHKLRREVIEKTERTFNGTLEQGDNVVCLIYHREPGTSWQNKNNRDKFKTWAKDKALTISCSVNKQDIPRWIEFYLGLKGCSVSRSIVNEIQMRSGSSLADLKIQLDKLAVYAGHEPVTAEDVRAVIRRSTETKIWTYTEALTKGNLKDAVAACTSILEDDPQAESLSLLSYTNTYLRGIAQVFTLYKQYRGNITQICDAIPGKKENQIRGSLRDSKMWDEQGLAEAFESLHKTDLKLKNGADPILTMQKLTMRLAGRHGIKRR